MDGRYFMNDSDLGNDQNDQIVQLTLYSCENLREIYNAKVFFHAFPSN